jgi:hypothetical protein
MKDFSDRDHVTRGSSIKTVDGDRVSHCEWRKTLKLWHLLKHRCTKRYDGMNRIES